MAQCKALTPNYFTDTHEIRHHLAAFQDRYNAVAQPFDWTFGRDNLDKLLTRIDAHAA